MQSQYSAMHTVHRAVKIGQHLTSLYSETQKGELILKHMYIHIVLQQVSV